MVWESFDRWPDEMPAGGAFRGRSEPIVARRDGVTLGERWRLFWKHSPDHDSKRAPRRATLTSTHLYVERLDGSAERVSRKQLRACRRMDQRLLFGIEGGEDLILPYRASDELQEELLVLAGGRGNEWKNDRHRIESLWLAAFGVCSSVVLFSEYRLSEARDRWADGMYTAEVCLGVYAALAVALLAVGAIAWMPSRIRIDRLGVERTRGFLGLFRFHVPADRIELVVTQNSRHRFETMLIFDEKLYIGTSRKTRGLMADTFEGRSSRNLAMRLSEQLAALLDARHRNLTH